MEELRHSTNPPLIYSMRWMVDRLKALHEQYPQSGGHGESEIHAPYAFTRTNHDRAMWDDFCGIVVHTLEDIDDNEHTPRIVCPPRVMVQDALETLVSEELSSQDAIDVDELGNFECQVIEPLIFGNDPDELGGETLDGCACCGPDDHEFDAEWEARPTVPTGVVKLLFDGELYELPCAIHSYEVIV